MQSISEIVICSYLLNMYWRACSELIHAKITLAIYLKSSFGVEKSHLKDQNVGIGKNTENSCNYFQYFSPCPHFDLVHEHVQFIWLLQTLRAIVELFDK